MPGVWELIMSQSTYRWWRDPSRLVRRFYWRMFLLPLPVSVLPLMVGLLTPLKDFLLPPSGSVTVGAIMIGVAVFFSLWFSTIILWEMRLVKKLRAADYKLCPHCGYMLTAHEGEFNCPECGKACDIDKIQAAWRSFRPRVTGGVP